MIQTIEYRARKTACCVRLALFGAFEAAGYDFIVGRFEKAYSPKQGACRAKEKPLPNISRGGYYDLYSEQIRMSAGAI